MTDPFPSYPHLSEGMEFMSSCGGKHRSRGIFGVGKFGSHVSADLACLCKTWAGTRTSRRAPVPTSAPGAGLAGGFRIPCPGSRSQRGWSCLSQSPSGSAAPTRPAWLCCRTWQICAWGTRKVLLLQTLRWLQRQFGFTLQILDVKDVVYPQGKSVCSQICFALVPLRCAEFARGCCRTQM